MIYSINELDFLKDNILKGIRPDLRNFFEIRNTDYLYVNNSQSDGSLEIKHGYSHIRLSIQFKEEGDNIIDSNYIIPYFYLTELKNKLEKYKIGLNINLEVFYDDGNILYLFIKGLNKLLSNITIPNIDNLEESISTNFDMSDVLNFGLFNEEIISDPIKIEEESCDVLFTVFHKQKDVLSIITNKSGKISREIIEKIYNIFNNKKNKLTFND